MVSPTQLCWRYHSLPLIQRYICDTYTSSIQWSRYNNFSSIKVCCVYSPASDQWIPLTKGQWCGKCIYVITLSWPLQPWSTAVYVEMASLHVDNHQKHWLQLLSWLPLNGFSHLDYGQPFHKQFRKCSPTCCAKYFCLQFWFCLCSQVIILHIAWQQNCHDMCKMFTWLDHYYSRKRKDIL